MRRHLKRQAAPKNWPIPRKGTKYIISNNSKGIPILIVLRDVLSLAQNKREVKKAIHKEDLLINGKVVIDEKKSLELFDVLTIIPSKKNYRIILTEKGKYGIEEIKESESKEKISKIVNKKSLKNKKVQINLQDGRNYLFDKKCSVNDSVVIDLVKGEVSKVLPFKEKTNALIIGGKHTGIEGVIQKIIPEHKMVELKTKEETLNVLIKQIMVTE